ncbi:hypothetical protein LDENG_00224610 [Lucifuga dentata]|nr:hypothetical protein LDENG_00224610 [Lucifuga dentata]
MDLVSILLPFLPSAHFSVLLFAQRFTSILTLINCILLPLRHRFPPHSHNFPSVSPSHQSTLRPGGGGRGRPQFQEG